ncbi:MAG: hypothetical protein ACI8W7_002622, partial [Gammaproteobacteria bacterium]
GVNTNELTSPIHRARNMPFDRHKNQVRIIG